MNPRNKDNVSKFLGNVSHANIPMQQHVIMNNHYNEQCSMQHMLRKVSFRMSIMTV